ncbi:hypothetical protein GM3708_2497 [Geminocystis sp. NIES-3708]|uniref:hypothetical protein n=1 Tax=Geminocystis sp. NIES-3708 TaxID=1615909 RepID=UPI0005FCC952|nr:hypothetical protein [Geminocystis sp. NIES-3708]BAQ62091.1 hypothetical protein GM3708_2497 [Geminocystis sp. NIES-3708]
MSTEDKARELMAKQRIQTNHETEILLSLTEQELHEHHVTELEEKARELLAENRQHDQNLQNNMTSRTEQELV